MSYFASDCARDEHKKAVEEFQRRKAAGELPEQLDRIILWLSLSRATMPRIDLPCSVW